MITNNFYDLLLELGEDWEVESVSTNIKTEEILVKSIREKRQSVPIV